ncbi:mechanosensitive ion channel family protein [Chloroflexota bacterium]
MKRKPVLGLALAVACLLLLLSATGGGAQAQTPESVPAPEGTAEESAEEGALDDLVVTRTPMPTATPGVLAEQVSELTREAGLAGESFLGLGADDWINLGISLLAVLAGYLIGTWLIRWILPRVTRRTATELDDRLLQATGSDIRWLVVLLVLRFATMRLTFLGAELKVILADGYYVLVLVLLAHIIWRLIDLADEEAIRRATEAGREDELSPVVTLLVRLGRVLVVLIAITILLSYFGINIGGFMTALGLGGLALSLAAQDTIADAIAGFIILVDQPFRIGDRIEIQEVDTWGDVVEIGLRTTRIRTRDNRMVIVPNSIIGTNQVVNYTYPDPRYRIQTHVGVAYGTDIETVRRIITDAVRTVDDVLPDEPVDALYNEMGDSAMIFRVRWWIESYTDTRHVIDRVHTALQSALDAAGIESPFPTQTLYLQNEGERTGRHSKSPGAHA